MAVAGSEWEDRGVAVDEGVGLVVESFEEGVGFDVERVVGGDEFVAAFAD